MKKYVLGFLFNKNLREVILLKKRVPANYTGEGRLKYQDGKINGVGGLILEDEQPVDALVRKVQAEVNIHTLVQHWQQVAEMVMNDGTTVSVFATKLADDQFYSMKQMTDEQCRQIAVAQVPQQDVLSNLLWLVPLAVDALNDPFHELMVQVNYTAYEALELNATQDGQAFAPETSEGGSNPISTSFLGGVENKGGGSIPTDGKDAAPVLDPANAVDHQDNMGTGINTAKDASVKTADEATQNEANPNGAKTRIDNKPEGTPKAK